MNSSSFRQTSSLYANIVESNDGTMGLIDEISSAEYPKQVPHSSVRIRRLNGVVGLYETSALLEWMDKNPIDPLTRADISKQLPRIKEKIKWTNMFKDLKNEDITPEFRKQALMDYMSDIKDDSKKEKARAFADMESYHSAGYLSNLTYHQTTVALACNTDKYILRKSSLHDSKILPKNTGIMVVGIVGEQKRLAEVDGFGFIFYKGSDIVEPMFISDRDIHICLVDAIESHVNNKSLLVRV